MLSLDSRMWLNQQLMVVCWQLELWDFTVPQFHADPFPAGWDAAQVYMDMSVSLVEQRKFSMSKQLLTRALEMREKQYSTRCNADLYAFLAFY